MYARRDRWAECKIFHVVEQYNQSTRTKVPDADLEKEVSDALVLAPRLDYAGQLMNEIRQRRRGSDAAVIEYHDLGRIPQGWLVGETTNFPIYYVQSPELARKATDPPEQARTRMDN